MSILIKAVRRYNPQKPKDPYKWYPVQNTTKQLDETEVAELVSEETTLNPSEALMAIRQLRKVVVRALQNSQSVKLGNWGSFSVSLHTAGAATQKELKTTAIKGVNMVFHPSDAVKAELQKSNFVWLEKLVNDTSNDGNKDAQIPEAPDSLG